MFLIRLLAIILYGKENVEKFERMPPKRSTRRNLSKRRRI